MSMSQWWALSDDDRAWALGLEMLEKEEAAYRCPVCGGDSRECQSKENARGYSVQTTRCYRQMAVMRNAEGYAKDKYAGTIVPRIKKLFGGK